jgi:hypothetical protein
VAQDWKLTGMLTDSSKTKRKREGSAGSLRNRVFKTKIHQNDCKNIIFYVLPEVQKDSDDVSAGMGIFFNSVHKNFVENLT